MTQLTTCSYLNDKVKGHDRKCKCKHSSLSLLGARRLDLIQHIDKVTIFDVWIEILDFRFLCNVHTGGAS